jgi:hypothetical protein
LQILPELIEIAGSGKTAGHADNGNTLGRWLR